MFDAVFLNIPLLYNYVVMLYNHSTIHLFGHRRILSGTGISQGCNLSGLLWCLTAKKLHDRLISRIHYAYVDDLTLAGEVDDLVIDLKLIIHEGTDLGLHVSFTKTQLILSNPDLIERFESFAPDLVVCQAHKAQLLGASLHPLHNTIRDNKMQEFLHFVSQIQYLKIHDALYLLINCYGASRLIYLLRTCSFIDPEFLSRYDSLSRRALSQIYNRELTDNQWFIASRPIKYGGLGLRLTTEIALPAFISSYNASKNLVETFLQTDISNDKFISKAMLDWRNLVGSVTPQIITKQKAWDSIVVLDSLGKNKLPLAAQNLVRYSQHSELSINQHPDNHSRHSDNEVRIFLASILGEE